MNYEQCKAVQKQSEHQVKALLHTGLHGEHLKPAGTIMNIGAWK